MRPALGTFVEIGVPADLADRDAVIDRAFECIKEVEARLNRHDPTSEVSRLNRDSCLYEMSDLGRAVLRLSRWMMRSSGGLFDCTFDATQAGRPDDIEIRGRHVHLHRKVKITLDGIAKGYAVDRAVKFLRRAGVRKAYVNAGGDLRVYGDLTLPLWRREADGMYRVHGHLKDAALASSYVSPCRDLSFTGQIAHRNGAAPEIGVWSVLAPSAWLADALTKVACLSLPDERRARIESLGGSVVAIDGVL